jgi:hypothetical protein
VATPRLATPAGRQGDRASYSTPRQSRHDADRLLPPAKTAGHDVQAATSSVATIAELAFAGQCALLLSKLSALTGNASLQVVGWSIVPLILLAQLFCWYAVISLNHLGHAIEEILWSVLAFLMALSLGLTLGQMSADGRILSTFGMVAGAGAALLMLAVDVPMYLARWRHARRSGVRHLSLMEGLRDALRRRQVAHRWSE